MDGVGLVKGRYGQCGPGQSEDMNGVGSVKRYGHREPGQREAADKLQILLFMTTDKH